MKLQTTRHFPVSAETLLGILLSRDFYQKRYAMSGIDDFSFDAFDQTPRGFLIRILRQMEIKSGSVPSFARKFVGSQAVLETEFLCTEKDQQPYRIEYRFSFGKVPVKVEGVMEIRDEEDGTARQDIYATVSSSIPLIGGKLAALVGEKADKGLQSDYRATCRYIEEHLPAAN